MEQYVNYLEMGTMRSNELSMVGLKLKVFISICEQLSVVLLLLLLLLLLSTAAGFTATPTANGSFRKPPAKTRQNVLAGKHSQAPPC